MTGSSKATDVKEPLFAVVLPAFNESRRIGAVVSSVRQYARHVIVVDDGSSDATAAEAEAAGAQVLKHGINRGKGAALETGMAHVAGLGFQCVITMDADGQHSPDDIPTFWNAFTNTSAPAILGDRMGARRSDMPRVRWWTNRLMSCILSLRMRQWVPDTQCGYRLYRVDILPLLRAGSGGFAAESEVLINIAAKGLKIASVPIQVIYRDEVSKIRPVRDTFRFIAMLWRNLLPKR